MMKNNKKRYKKYKLPKCEKIKPIISTYNGRLIYELMKENKVKGKYKDYVIITGTKIIDWLNVYEMAINIKEDIHSYGMDGIALIHKSRLKNIIGEEAAKKFWNHGIRTNDGIEIRRANCYKRK